MELLIGVLVVVGVILFLLFVWRFAFQKPDPTKAKIPDHMKTGVGWKTYEREQEKEKRRRRSWFKDAH